MTNQKILLALAIAALVTAASAQSRRFYDASGKSVGTSSTDSQGTTRFYNAAGKNVGTSSTDSQRTTTFYDSRGKVVGKESKSGSGRHVAQ
jgi:YD repeat-containing protein